MFKKILFTLAFLFCSVSQAETIKIIVPFAAGGPYDTLARAIEHTLTTTLKEPVVVEYRLGAGGNIATQSVINDKSQDILLLVQSSAVITNAVSPDNGYDIKNNLVPVAYLGDVPLALVVNKKTNIKSVKEFLDLGKNKPLFYGSGGIGTGTHIASEVLKMQTGMNLIHAPYKGETPAMIDLVGGNLNFMFTATPNALKYSDNVRILAVTGKHRDSAVPSVPTLKESGIPGYEYSIQYAMVFANNKADPRMIKLIQMTLYNALSQPENSKEYLAMGLRPNLTKLTNFEDIIDFNLARTKKLLNHSVDTKR